MGKLRDDRELRSVITHEVLSTAVHAMHDRHVGGAEVRPAVDRILNAFERHLSRTAHPAEPRIEVVSEGPPTRTLAEILADPPRLELGAVERRRASPLPGGRDK